MAGTAVGEVDQLPTLDFVSQKKIDEHKQNIARTIKRHKYLRIALQAGAYSIAAYGCYRLFFVSSGSTKKKEILLEKENKPSRWKFWKKRPESKPSDPNNLTPNPNHLTVEEIKKWRKNNETSIWSLPSTVFSFVNRYVFPPIYSSVILTAGKKLLGGIFHDDTIAWFAEEKTTVARLRDVIISHTEKINDDEEILPDEQRAYYEGVFVGMGRSLVPQVETIVAFIEYQLEEYKNRGAILTNDELLHASHLIAMTNNFVSSLRSLRSANGDTITHERLKKIANSSQQFILDLCQLIECFVGVEDRIEWRFA